MWFAMWSDVYEAYIVFRRLNGLARNQNSRLLFLKFLGAYDFDQLSEDAKHKVRWLTDPNAEVMYKVWKAQNDNRL